jgi:transcription termination/antitermination protein NusG
MNGLQRMASNNVGPVISLDSSFTALSGCPAMEQTKPVWYAAYTKGRHEKHVSRQLEERQINNFLPVYHSVRRWKDRRKELALPLFPGYVFVQISAQDRVKILQVPGVVRFVSFNGRPAVLEISDIESLKNGMAAGVKAEPHPYLKIGQKVFVKHGPLAGATGILIRKKDTLRLVISLDLIMRSIVAEVQAADIDNRY